jgi:hypothetical protein
MKKLSWPDFSGWSLQGAVHWLEDSIVTLSGPAIAISGIVAGVDILTGGTLMRQQGWLSYVWAIALLITLDFQVLVLASRARRIYQGNALLRRKVGEIILIVTVAAAISYVSVQMQSIMARMQEDGPHATIAASAAELGIDNNALIWERSALVLTLIFLSGWTKESNAANDHRRVLVSAVPTTEQIIEALSPVIVEKLSQLSVTLTDDTVTKVTEKLSQTVTGDTEKLSQKLVSLSREMTELSQKVTVPVPENTLDVTVILERLSREMAQIRVTVTEEVTREMTEQVTRLSREMTEQVTQLSVTVTEEVSREMTEQFVPMIEERVTRDSDSDSVARLIEEALSKVKAPLPEPVLFEQRAPRVSQMTARKSVTVTKNLDDSVRNNVLETAYQAMLRDGGKISGRELSQRTGIGRNIAIAWFKIRHGVTNDSDEE